MVIGPRVPGMAAPGTHVLDSAPFDSSALSAAWSDGVGCLGDAGGDVRQLLSRAGTTGVAS